MKSFESQMISVFLHGALLVYTVYYFVPPKVMDQGHGMLLEMVSAQKNKGVLKRAPRVAKAKKEILSKPVVIATKPKVKKVVKRTEAPRPKVKKPVAPKNKKAVIVQKAPSRLQAPDLEKSTAQREQPKTTLPKKWNEKKGTPVKTPPAIVSRSTGEKPAPPAAAPTVGDAKALLAEALGTKDGVRDGQKLSQIPGNLPPTYPATDRLNNREGKVVLLAYINSQGMVDDIQLESNTGSYLMETASFDAFSQFQFSKGQPGWVRMPFEFKLKGPAKELHAQIDENEGESLEDVSTEVYQ